MASKAKAIEKKGASPKLNNVNNRVNTVLEALQTLERRVPPSIMQCVGRYGVTAADLVRLGADEVNALDPNWLISTKTSSSSESGESSENHSRVLISIGYGAWRRQKGQ